MFPAIKNLFSPSPYSETKGLLENEETNKQNLPGIPFLERVLSSTKKFFRNDNYADKTEYPFENFVNQDSNDVIVDEDRLAKLNEALKVGLDETNLVSVNTFFPANENVSTQTGNMPSLVDIEPLAAQTPKSMPRVISSIKNVFARKPSQNKSLDETENFAQENLEKPNRSDYEKIPNPSLFSKFKELSVSSFSKKLRHSTETLEVNVLESDMDELVDDPREPLLGKNDSQSVKPCDKKLKQASQNASQNGNNQNSAPKLDFDVENAFSTSPPPIPSTPSVAAATPKNSQQIVQNQEQNSSEMNLGLDIDDAFNNPNLFINEELPTVWKQAKQNGKKPVMNLGAQRVSQRKQAENDKPPAKNSGMDEIKKPEEKNNSLKQILVISGIVLGILAVLGGVLAIMNYMGPPSIHEFFVRPLSVGDALLKIGLPTLGGIIIVSTISAVAYRKYHQKKA